MSLQDLALSPNGFVFDPLTGATFTANATARTLIEGVRDGASQQELVALLKQNFNVAGCDPARDVLEFVRQLRAEGLISNDFELE